MNRLSPSHLFGRIRQWFQPSDADPGCASLMVHLFTFSAILAGLGCISPTTYRDAPVIRSIAEETQATSKAGEPRRLPIVVQGLEGTAVVTRTLDNDEGLQSMQARMAVNILLRSGYLTQAQVTADTGELDSMPRYAVQADYTPLDCANRGASDGGESDFTALALAVVAAEKFNRTSWHRYSEWILAEAGRLVTGHLPDLSLGVAQIRPSTVRIFAAKSKVMKALAPQLDDISVGAALADECRSLGLTTAILQAMATEHQSSKRCTNGAACQQEAIMSFGGRSHRSQAVVDYLGLVLRMREMIDQGLPTSQESSETADCPAGTGCEPDGRKTP